MNNVLKQLNARRSKARVRAKVRGSSQRPRVCVRASLNNMFVQFIDDEKGVTLISGRDAGIHGTKVERAAALGGQLAGKLKDLGIKSAVFDRGEKRYHGRIKSFADALRKGGIIF